MSGGASEIEEGKIQGFRGGPIPRIDNMEPRSARSISVHVIFFLSGVAGLGYQIVWTRMFSIGLGHEMPSLLAVVAAFFAGLALGSWLLDARVTRSRVPGRWYAGLEAAIGVWAMLTALLIPSLNEWTAGLIGITGSAARHWLAAFGIPFLALLPATTAMGGSFPAMERLTSRLSGSGRTVAGLYACNTAGAVAGTLATTFVIAPSFGFTATVLALAAINFVCAGATAFGPAVGERARPPVLSEFADPPSPRRLAATVFCTGLLGIGYEVLSVRVLSQVLQNTVYTFASTLSIFLLGTAVGATLYQRYASKERFFGPLASFVISLNCACVLGIVTLWHSRAIYEIARDAFGHGSFGSILAEMFVALCVFALPTATMGATFSHLVQAARRRDGGVGRAMALNTFGSSLAPFLFGVWLLPQIGLFWALLLCSFAYLFLVPYGRLELRRAWPVAATPLALLLLPSDRLLFVVPPNATLADHREGVRASVAVIDFGDAGRQLTVNNRFAMGGTVLSFVDRRQAHIPLLLHPDPKSVLFLGVGSGVTVGAATRHPDLELRAVELLPEIVDLLPNFAPGNHLADIDVGRQVVVADARRFVRATDEKFDVVVADLFHPARDGAGALYTKEHFEAIRSRLREGGLFCQWIPLYQLDLEVARLIVRTFLEVFPDTTAYLGHFNVDTAMLGLVGSLTPRRYSESYFSQRVRHLDMSEFAPLQLDNPFRLFGCLFATRESLVAFAGRGALNTDDRPLVIFRAPSFVYRDESSWGRLDTLLRELRADVGDVAVEADASSEDRVFAERLADYIQARNLYLDGLIQLRNGHARTGAELLEQSVEASRDFRVSYAMYVQDAGRRFPSDPAGSRAILQFLMRARPEDPRAGQVFRKLFGE